MGVKVRNTAELDRDSVTLKVELTYCGLGDGHADVPKPRISLSWTCPECAGHGCRWSDSCCNGQQRRRLSSLDELAGFVGSDDADTIRSILEDALER